MEGLDARKDDGDSSVVTDSSSAIQPDGDPIDDDEDFYQSLNQQRLEKRNTNVCIECNGTKFPAHNYVLACRSNYFYKKFCNDEVGMMDGSHLSIVMNEYHPCVMETIIDYIYKDVVDLYKLSDENLEMFVLCGRSLELVDFETSLLHELLENLKPSNFHLSLLLARQTRDISAEAKVLTYVCQHLTTISQTVDFVALDEDQLHFIFENCRKILSCHDILLDCLLKWVNQDVEKREATLARLLGHISFNRVTKAAATAALYNQLVYNKPPLKDEVLRVIHRDDCEVYSDTSCNDTIPLEMHNAVKAVGPDQTSPTLLFIGRGERNSGTAVTYDVNADEWYQPCDLEITLSHQPGIGYDGQNLLFIGGSDINDLKQNSCILYNFCNRTTRTLPDLRIARAMPLVFPFDGTIYAIGGSGRYSNEGLSHGEYLTDIYSTVWKVMQPMRVKRNGLATACVFNSYIYVGGGGTGKVERYLTSQKTWDLLTPVSEDDFHDGNVHISAASGRVCALKFYKPNFILTYNHERNHWETEIIRGTPPEFVAHTVGWGSKIFTLDQENRLYILDIAAYMWFEISKIPSKCLNVPHYMSLF